MAKKKKSTIDDLEIFVGIDVHEKDASRLKEDYDSLIFHRKIYYNPVDDLDRLNLFDEDDDFPYTKQLLELLSRNDILCGLRVYRIINDLKERLKDYLKPIKKSQIINIANNLDFHPFLIWKALCTDNVLHYRLHTFEKKKRGRPIDWPHNILVLYFNNILRIKTKSTIQFYPEIIDGFLLEQQLGDHRVKEALPDQVRRYSMGDGLKELKRIYFFFQYLLSFLTEKNGPTINGVKLCRVSAVDNRETKRDEMFPDWNNFYPLDDINKIVVKMKAISKWLELNISEFSSEKEPESRKARTNIEKIERMINSLKDEILTDWKDLFPLDENKIIDKMKEIREWLELKISELSSEKEPESREAKKNIEKIERMIKPLEDEILPILDENLPDWEDSLLYWEDSLCRFVRPEDALALQTKSVNNHGITFAKWRSAGSAIILKALWDRINIKQCLDKILKDRSVTAPMEQALFAMVAKRALDPASKLTVEQWANKDVYLGIDDQIQVKHLYRSMDLLLEKKDAIQKEVFWSTANLLNLTVDLVFFDTINTYFEIDDPGDSELKAYSKSKHKRDDLPHVTIGHAVTREGIPVRCFIMPGNQNDAKCVDQFQKDLNNWKLGRVVWAMDRSMTSKENRRILQRAGAQYILGEKLSGTKANEEALNRGGRFKVLNKNLHIKEVFVGEGTGRRRFIIAYNPQQAKYDSHVREKILKWIVTELAVMNKFAKDKQAKAKYHLLTHKSMGRYLKEQKNGKLQIDQPKVKQDQKLDGKYLLSTSDESLSAEDVALGYKQVMEVERTFRNHKDTLSLRPMYHTEDDRIRSNILLCWLALLLVRIAENESGSTWSRLHAEMEKLHIFVNKDGRILRHTEFTPNQLNIFKTLKIDPPRYRKNVDLIA